MHPRRNQLHSNQSKSSHPSITPSLSCDSLSPRQTLSGAHSFSTGALAQAQSPRGAGAAAVSPRRGGDNSLFSPPSRSTPRSVSPTPTPSSSSSSSSAPYSAGSSSSGGSYISKGSNLSLKQIKSYLRKSSSKDMKRLSKAYDSLFRLSLLSENHASILKDGVLPLLKSTASTHLQDLFIQQTVCGILWHLLSPSSSRLQTSPGQVTAVFSVSGGGGGDRLLSIPSSETAIMLAGERGEEDPSSPRVEVEETASLVNPRQLDIRRAVLCEGFLQCIHAAMTTHLRDLKLQQLCCACLWSLSLRSVSRSRSGSGGEGLSLDARLQMGRLGLLECIREAMAQFQTDVVISQYSCGALANLSREAELKEAIVRLGLLKTCLKPAMDLHWTDEVIQQTCASSLFSLTKNSIENKSLLVAAGLLVSIKKALGSHTLHARLQNTLLRLLGNAGNTIEHRLEIQRLGFLETFPETMNRHLRDIKIQRNACAALHKITNIREEDDEDDNGQQASSSNSSSSSRVTHEPVIIVTTSDTNSSGGTAPQTEPFAVQATSSLVLSRNNRQTSLASMTISLLPAVLRESPKDNKQPSSTYTSSRSGDSTIQLSEEEGRVNVTKLGLLEPLKAAMSVHFSDMKLQKYACGFIRNVCNTMENGEAVLDSGLLENLKTAMTRHIRDKKVQRNGCEALRNLSVNQHNRTILFRVGMIENVKLAMSTHPTYLELQQSACAFLLNLSKSKDLVNLLLFAPSSSGSFLENVKSAMVTHTMDLKLQQLVCGLLYSLAKVQKNREVLLRAGGFLEELNGSFAAFPADSLIAHHVYGFLAHVSSDEQWSPLLRDVLRTVKTRHEPPKDEKVLKYYHRLFGVTEKRPSPTVTVTTSED